LIFIVYKPYGLYINIVAPSLFETAAKTMLGIDIQILVSSGEKKGQSLNSELTSKNFAPYSQFKL
jgi:hypothetical protein